jgi:hypothetical protein
VSIKRALSGDQLTRTETTHMMVQIHGS